MRRYSLLYILLSATGVVTSIATSAQAASYFSFSIGGPGYHLKYGYSGSHYGYPGYQGYPRYYFPYSRHGVRYRGYRDYYHRHYYGGFRRYHGYSGFWTPRGVWDHPDYRDRLGYKGYHGFNRHHGHRGHGYKRYYKWGNRKPRYFGHRRW